eukprot:7382256-Prymnesium_polylepis.1
MALLKQLLLCCGCASTKKLPPPEPVSPLDGSRLDSDRARARAAVRASKQAANRAQTLSQKAQ